MNPTEKQIKDFWDWCGLDLKHKFEPIGVDNMRVCSRCGAVFPHPIFKNCCEPELDLNNLFRDAVPSVIEKFGLAILRIELLAAIFRAFKEDKDPALALFWAIWGVIKESE